MCDDATTVGCVLNTDGDARQSGSTDPQSVLATGITKHFGAVAALQDVDLHVEAGSMLALLGPSGCGKTTLLRVIAGLERPDTGRIDVGGVPLTGPDVFVPPERRRIGMVFQDWALFPHLSVERNVAYGVAKLDGAARKARVRDALEMVGLAPFGDRAPATLSGGQQQRVALARALAPQPSVLLLDEPFSNLDSALRVQVRTEVHRLLADLGVTTVFVTHDQEEAFVLGDDVAVMDEGHVVQQAAPAELYRAPASQWVASFVGDANLVEGSVCDGVAQTVLGPVHVASAVTGVAEVLVRPETIELHPGTSAVVELVEFYGHDTVYVIKLRDGTCVRSRHGSAPRFARGEGVDIRYVGSPTMAYALNPETTP